MPRYRIPKTRTSLTTTQAASLLAGSTCRPCDTYQSSDTDTDTPAATWTGPIVFEGQMTGDGRMIEKNALEWADLPLPIRMVKEDVGAHDGAMVVGRIQTLERRAGGEIWGTGDFDTGSEEGREAIRLVREDIKNGVSVDLDQVSFEVRVAREALDGLLPPTPEGDEPPVEAELVEEVDEDGRVTVLDIDADDEVMVTTGARIRAVTLVDVPAFAGARIALDSDTGSRDDNALVASVIGDDDLPVSDRDASWDGDAAAGRVFDWATNDDGEVDTTAVARAFLWRDEDADPTTRQAYKLGFADVIDGTLTIIPAGISATAGGRGVGAADIPDSDKDAVRDRICSVYETVRDTYDDWPACPFDDTDDTDTDTTPDLSVVTAGGGPEEPPASWFNNPDLSGPTPLTVTDEGRIYGHLAAWGTCHTGQTRQCVTPPTSTSGYAYFRRGSVVTREGAEIPVGVITLDTLHASESFGPTAAAAHYENTGRQVADVAAGEDAHGIWVAGAVRPGTTAEQLRVLRASPLSGDWRRIGGTLELIGALAVNVPGFPIPRPQGLVAGGTMTSLVASGMIPPSRVLAPGQPGALSEDDLRYLVRLANRERREEQLEKAGLEDRAAALARRVRASKLAQRVRKLS